MKIRIATRKSPLALWQAEYVQVRLLDSGACEEVQLVPMTTEGDQRLDSTLAKVGGKGLFLKELEHALLADRADIAVHSMKDVPVEMPDGLEINTVCAREVPFDALVSNKYESLSDMPGGAVVGTSSLRRACQLRNRFPEIKIEPLRGNVNSRLDKLDNDQYDAIILAAAGLTRLGMQFRIRQTLSADLCVPAIGQGIVGIETRAGDENVSNLVSGLHDDTAWHCLNVERTVGAALGASCQAPVAAYASMRDDGKIDAIARVGSMDASRLIEATVKASDAPPAGIGRTLAKDLEAQGAQELLAEFLNA